jgi:hypothetical protein
LGANDRFGSKADIARQGQMIVYVRFAPESGHGRFVTACPLRAISGCEQPQ